VRVSVLIAALVALPCLPTWADTYSFVGVKDSGVSASDVLDARYGYTDSVFRADTDLATASGDGNLARAQTGAGVNRIEVSNSRLVTDEHIRDTGIGGPFAIALSGWTDEFTITGGTGVGKALVSVNVTGRFGEGFGSGGGYGLWLGSPEGIRSEVTEFLATDPTAWILETVDAPDDGDETLLVGYLANVLKEGHTDPGLSLPPGSDFGGLFTREVQFTYGESFAMASVLYGFANDTGSLSAMNSAHFGISVIDNGNALIASRSNAAYAAAVPEPASLSLILAGGLALMVRGRGLGLGLGRSALG
jgi:hypothetical protein